MTAQVVTLRPDANVDGVRRALIAHGLWVDRLAGLSPAQFLIAPHSAKVDAGALARIEGIAQVGSVASGHPLVDAAAPIALVKGVAIGVGQPVVFAAGPCSVESEAQINDAAARLAATGVKLLR